MAGSATSPMWSVTSNWRIYGESLLQAQEAHDTGRGEIDPTGVFMIGAVDIGGTKIAVGVVDDSGKILSRMEAPTDPHRYSDSIELIAHMLRKTAQKVGVEITGIGIGSTGPVDPMSGTFGDVDFLPGWRGKCPVRDLATVFAVPVALENDGDAAALAEAG